jgi:hypothetical protein
MTSRVEGRDWQFIAFERIQGIHDFGAKFWPVRVHDFSLLQVRPLGIGDVDFDQISKRRVNGFQVPLDKLLTF